MGWQNGWGVSAHAATPASSDDDVTRASKITTTLPAVIEMTSIESADTVRPGLLASSLASSTFSDATNASPTVVATAVWGREQKCGLWAPWRCNVKGREMRLVQTHGRLNQRECRRWRLRSQDCH